MKLKFNKTDIRCFVNAFSFSNIEKLVFATELEKALCKTISINFLRKLCSKSFSVKENFTLSLSPEECLVLNYVLPQLDFQTDEIRNTTLHFHREINRFCLSIAEETKKPF